MDLTSLHPKRSPVSFERMRLGFDYSCLGWVGREIKVGYGGEGKNEGRGKISLKSVHVNITLSLSQKPEGKNTKLHIGIQRETEHRSAVPRRYRNRNKKK